MVKRELAERFINFFLVEQQLRWITYLSASAIALAWALIRIFFFHKGEEEVSVEATILLCILVATTATVYVSYGTMRILAQALPAAPRFSRRLGFAGTAALAFFVCMANTRPSKMQAAVMDLRLDAATTFLGKVQAAALSDQQLSARYRKLESIVETSSTKQIPVDAQLLQEAQTAVSHSLKVRSVSEQTKQLAWGTAIDLQSLAYKREAQTGVLTEVPARQIVNTNGVLVASPISLNDQRTYILGDHAWVTLGPPGPWHPSPTGRQAGGQFVIDNSRVVFDKINFLGFNSPESTYVYDWDYTVQAESAIALVGPAEALVSDSTMNHVIQSLDRIIWVDVRFENSVVLYGGGPVTLRNVSFKDCSLETHDLSSELGKRIDKAKGQPITFIYEPER